MRLRVTLAVLLSVFAVVPSASAAHQATKLKLKVAADGFPAGHDTPEGTAADLARAFIKNDVGLFTQTCIGLYAGHTGPAAYDQFMQATIASLQQQASRKEPLATAPKAIAKVFAAPHLSHNGPASYGYATFDFQDVMFVDISLELHNGKNTLSRTLVIQMKEGSWYAHPAPDVSPLLSFGLNDESPSVVDFKDAYAIQK